MAESSAEKRRVGLLLSDDLMFTSRITGTAQALGLQVKPARNTGALQTLAQQQAPSCVIVDLANPGLIIGELIAWLGQNCQPVPRIVGYGSHVDAEMLRKAREAGCDAVLPRSKFVEELPRELGNWMKS